ncbi:WXG100-like domain-containing protein [Nonomuraea sp. 10N515B]|uniref:WXG100-like domain-containing protein n=1 Tax=Nonomuraea sp. 10N515B TaxID=3457422 RepID=UPI003FCC421D
MTVNAGVGVDSPGQPNAQPPVQIDSDVLPAWETETLPDWVNRWLIPLLSAGQKWPETSESGMSYLAGKYDRLATGSIGFTPLAGSAARTIVTGWVSPATANFVTRAQFLHGHEGGLAGVSGNARAYAQQANNFAVQTQYSKLSINVAFWVTVIAIAIALFVAFFTAGSSTAIIGPYAAGARAAISRIIVRLATLGARELGTTQLARVTALSGATGRGLLARLLSTAIGKELVEEIGEEFIIDAVAQYQQIKMGTRKNWDWRQSWAAIIGAGSGAIIGTKVAGPVSRLTRSVPGFAGRALTTGLTNTIASPVGSFIANGVVYGQWQNPFTADSLLGGFMGGAGRTGTISPFNPDVYTALAHPLTSLASAYNAAAHTDAARAAGDPPGGTAGGNPSNGGRTPSGGQPDMSGSVQQPEPATPAPTRSGGTATAPDLNTTSSRRGSTPNADQNRTDERPEAARQADPASRPIGEAAPQSGRNTTAATPSAQNNAGTAERLAPSAATAAQTPDGTNAQHDDNPARPDSTPAQSDGQQARPSDQAVPAAQATGDQAVPAAQATGDQTVTADDGSGHPVSSLTGSESAATPMTAAERARTALIGALATDFPDAMIGPTGDLLITSANGVRVISTATMTRIRAALDTRAEEVPNLAELQAEAAAMLAVAQGEETAAPETDAAPADGPAAAPAYTSKPGTVTSRPVPGTRYVPGGRQGEDLDLDEVGRAIGNWLARHFLDQGVTRFTWSKDSKGRRTLAVHTETDGIHYFRPVIGKPSSDLMARTEINTGRDVNDPHVVHFNPRVAADQLSRVWLHEITDTLQEVRSAGEGKRQGVLRRGRGGEATQDACVPAFYNELSLLAGKWHQAQTLAEKRLLAVDIDGVARRLRERGHTPPLPPWAPAQATRPRHAPALPGEGLSADDVRAVIDALVRAEQDLQLQITTKTDSAKEAGEEARKAARNSVQARMQHDQGRFERARKARQEIRKHRATRARHIRIAEANAIALAQATQARKAYERLLAAMSQAGRLALPGEVGMATIAQSLEAEARRHHKGYLDALAEALPHKDSLSTTMPGPLAHLNALTEAVNDLLERNKIGHRFDPDQLERALRADWHKIVSPDGAVLRVGRGSRAAEVRIRLSLADLIEVLDPAVKASEMMVGLFFQSGRTVTATESGSGGLPLGFNTAALAKLLPEGESARMLAELLGVGVGVVAGRNWSATGGAGMYAQGGSVADNRSESLLFDAAATWTVEIRTGQDESWRDTTVVDSGKPGDFAGQRMWVSHSFTDRTPRRLAWIDGKKRDPKLPNHVLANMTGLEGALDKIAATLGGEYTEVGAVPHDQLRTFVTDELPHRLRDAVNNGLERVFTKDGEPHARVRAETRVVLVASEPLGGTTQDEWEEEVLVDFVSAPGGASSGGSLEANASAGFNDPALQEVGGPGGYQPSIGPRVRGSRSVSRSYSATANMQAIHPSVHRKTSTKQSYRLALETTFTVEVFGKPPVTLRPVHSEAVVSMRESAAYRFGLPVDHAALVYKGGKPLIVDGNQVLRGDPRPGPPPGRKAELPVWLGDGPGQMRGAGPALVQEITGLDDVRKKVLAELAERGIIPKVENGVPQYSSNRLARAAQILNLQEVTEQLSEHRIRSAYDSLAQDGILVDLVMHGLNNAPEHHTLRVSLKQDFNDTKYVGYSESETVVNLEIGSDTSARAVGRSRTYAGGASVSESDGPDQGHDGLSHEAGVNAGGSRTRAVGWSVGSTVNVVTLQESTGPVAIFSVGHELTVELVHDGETTLLATDEGKGRARLLFAADLLPSENESAPTPLGKMSRKVLSKAKLLHFDSHGSLEPAAKRVLPRGMRPDSVAYQTIKAMLGVRNLVSHPRMLMRMLTTGLGIRTKGMPSRSSLTVQGEVGDVEVLGVVDHVSGDILFGLGSAGVSWGGSSGVSAGASTNVSDLDGGGASSDGGKLSLPSRSGGTSVSTSILDIWGSEELAINFGRQYILRANVDLTLTGSESAADALPLADRVPLGEAGEDTAQGTALFSLPEDDALLLYSEGELPLPGALVADAIERFVNGSLSLDPSLAVPLVQRYVMDVAKARAAGEDVGYADRHPRRALLAKIQELTGLGPTATTARQAGEQQLDQTLSDAADLVERSREVVVAPSFDRGMARVKSFELSDDQGNPVDFMDAVLGAVRTAAPEGVDESPTLSEELSVDFSHDAARIHVIDMWSARGYEKTYHVQTGPQTSQAEEVTVTARLVYDDPADSRKARLLMHTSQAGDIDQDYRYLDLSHSESYNGSYSAGLDYSSSDHGDGNGAGVSTDRGRSYTGSTNQQSTELQRMAQFNGVNWVEQKMTLVIEVTRKPVRRGRISAAAHRAADALRRRPRTARVTHRATLVRRIPTGMIRPIAEDPGPVVMVSDPRQVELRPGHFAQRLVGHPGKPTLVDVVTAQLTKMLGAKAVDEHQSKLTTKLSLSALKTEFERMTGPRGDVVDRVPRQKFKDQGAQFSVRARMSDFTIIAGPFETERGRVNRKADAENVTVSRSQVLPVSQGGSLSDGESGLNGGVRAGEQASQSVTDHHGARRERSEFIKGKAYTVRLRVDYDLTFEYVARLRNGDERVVGDPIHLPGATSGEVDVVLFEDEIAELRARVEADVRLAPAVDHGWPTFAFAPHVGREGLIQILQDARLAARERGAVARVAVRDADGIHRYLAAPDGSVQSETPDGGFAEAFATLSPVVLDAADEAGLDLRDVFMNSEEPGTFSHQVKAALMARGVFPVDTAKAAWPVDRQEEKQPVGGSVAQGLVGGTVSDPAIEDTPLGRSARPDDVPDLTLDETRRQDTTAGDLGGAAAHLRWGRGGMLTVQVPTAPDQHIRVLIGEPGEGLDASTDLRAGTQDDPHLLRIWPRVHPDVVSSVLVHELSHITQAAVAAAAGAPHGVIRTSLSENQAEGTDYCLIPRLDEHAHLSRKWHATSDQATRELLADAIDAISADIDRRGHTPPLPPWGTGPRAPAPSPPQSRIARLLNGESPAGPDTSPAGLGRLAEIAGVAEMAPAGRARELTVTTRDGTFTVALADAAPDATEVTVDSRTQDRLVLRVPRGAGRGADVAVAEQIAAHAAALAGRPPARTLAPGPMTPGQMPGTGPIAPGPVLGVPDAVTLARLRGLTRVISEAGPAGATAERAALRTEAERAGLAPGRPGAAPRLLALARAGELSPAHVAAIRGHATLPEMAAAGAIERGAALMGARVHTYGPGLMDIVVPGRAPIPVEVRPDQAGDPEPGMLTFPVDGHRTIGANERAAAATAAGAVARSLGGRPGDHAALAELYEAVRQARAATARQRPARLGVLFDLLATARPEVWRLLPEPLATELATLANGRRPRDWPAYLDHLRALANTTGWYRPDCRCPADEPCVCGRRGAPPPLEVAATASV